MTSHPPGECCLRTITHEGTPEGKVETIKHIETYITRPPTPSKKAILLLSDIFGHGYLNTQLMADRFANTGYLVVVPDLFNGDPVLPSDFFSGKADLPTWGVRHGTELIDPIISTIIEHLRKEEGIEKVAGVGYCFGGKYVVRHLHDGNLDCGYTAHPSSVTPEELASIKKPLSIAAAEIDNIFTPENRVESEGILAKVGLPWQINLYSGVAHGFAVKGDLSKKEVQFATTQAFEQAVAWFKYHL